MKCTKRTVLNFSLLLTVVLTFIFAILGLLELEKASQTAQSGAELLPVAIGFGMLVFGVCLAVIMELSLYFNLRYFMLCKEKTALKTGFNISILLSTVLLFVSLLLYGTMLVWAEYLSLAFLTAFIVLRIAYSFVSDK